MFHCCAFLLSATLQFVVNIVQLTDVWRKEDGNGSAVYRKSTFPPMAEGDASLAGDSVVSIQWIC